MDPTTGAVHSRRFVVRVLSGPDRDELFSVDAECTVGTAEHADLKLSDAAVSRAHLKLRPEEDGLRVEDLGSSNGTFIGAAQIDRAVIRGTTQLTLGTSVLEVQLEEAELTGPAGLPSALRAVVAKSKAMQRVVQLLSRVASLDLPIIFVGETGAGKDFLARALHKASVRRDGPFVVCDCAALAPQLVESELFGHAQGAFTGAAKAREGLFGLAHGGTLVLDGVDGLPLELQAKLLRVLETRRFRPVGGDEERSVDVRVMASTQRWLEAEAQAGRFRQDLYYRLAVVLAQVPPLRARREDIEPLADELLKASGKSTSVLTADVLARLKSSPWRGNVRELASTLERIASGQALALAEPADPTSEGATPNADLHSLPFKDAKEMAVDRFTREYVQTLLARHEGVVAKAAESSGLSRTYLHHLVRKLGLEGS